MAPRDQRGTGNNRNTVRGRSTKKTRTLASKNRRPAEGDQTQGLAASNTLSQVRNASSTRPQTLLLRSSAGGARRSLALG